MSAASGRRAWLRAAAAALVLPGLPVHAQADWPSRPIKFIVPYAPGGGTDVIGRAVAGKLAARLGQPVLVENRSGAGGSLGIDAVAKAAPDGYTLLFITTAYATIAGAGKKLPYDPVKDLLPVALIGSTPLLVVVRGDSRFKTLRDLVEQARARPDGISYGSSGIGSMSHLGMALLASEAKVSLMHVPYKGMAPAFTDLIAGSVQAAVSTYASAAPLMEAGRLRALAVTGSQRSKFVPQVPTVVEAGFPGSRIDFWWGLMAPSRLPPALVRRLNDEVNAILGQADMQELLQREGGAAQPGSPDDFARLLSFDLARWGKLIRDADIRTE